MKERVLILCWLAMIMLAPGLMLIADWVAQVGSTDTSAQRINAPTPLAEGSLDTLPQRIGDWFETNIPTRVPAIRADADIDLNLFRDSPNQRVMLGRDGWLFYRQSQTLGCGASADGEKLARVLAGTVEILETLDRQAHFIIAPDKASIYPEFLSPQ